MPGITLTVSGQANQDLTNRLAKEITDLTSRLLNKPHDRTWIIVRYEPKENWFIDGHSLVQLSKNAFRLWITITDETNSKEEKAALHREAFSLLSDIIGNVHPISNIYIIDARAAAYGYAGTTQEYNFHHRDS